MAKYRVTDKMPVNRKGWKLGDIVDIDPEIAVLYLAKGYIEPPDVTEAMQDTQIKHARHKEMK